MSPTYIPIVNHRLVTNRVPDLMHSSESLCQLHALTGIRCRLHALTGGENINCTSPLLVDKLLLFACCNTTGEPGFSTELRGGEPGLLQGIMKKEGRVKRINQGHLDGCSHTNQQESAWECGYYVMYFMFHFALYQQSVFPNRVPWNAQHPLQKGCWMI
ncbi:hypothetical protein L6452_13689 [Arctium lappa]|uniref:Uncharacterized protein n=1 Tax=Arctium lappa TaxID=4217 RepID=A0ACB9CJ77_ARCLA|nr:hypothetical protein L6452_13689 [Arctium lappa]